VSYINFSDEDDEEEKFNLERRMKGIEDFDKFKAQFNLKEILDKIIVKREFYIPSKTKDINQFYTFDKVTLSSFRKTKPIICRN